MSWSCLPDKIYNIERPAGKEKTDRSKEMMILLLEFGAYKA